MAATVPVTCIHCDGAATLHLRERLIVTEQADGTTDRYAIGRIDWQCPWCHRPNSGQYRGNLAWVAASPRLSEMIR